MSRYAKGEIEQIQIRSASRLALTAPVSAQTEEHVSGPISELEDITKEIQLSLGESKSLAGRHREPASSSTERAGLGEERILCVELTDSRTREVVKEVLKWALLHKKPEIRGRGLGWEMARCMDWAQLVPSDIALE